MEKNGMEISSLDAQGPSCYTVERKGHIIVLFGFWWVSSGATTSTASSASPLWSSCRPAVCHSNISVDRFTVSPLSTSKPSQSFHFLPSEWNVILLKDRHDVHMDTNKRNKRHNQITNASFKHVNPMIFFFNSSDPFVKKCHSKGERQFMRIVILSGVHVHSHSASVFLVGVKLSPLPVCTTSACSISTYFFQHGDKEAKLVCCWHTTYY